MNLLHYLYLLPWNEPLGWTLVHFLWQGLLIGFLVWAGLRLNHAASPNRRYAIAVAGMILSALAPIFTFIHLAKPFHSATPAEWVIRNYPSQVAPNNGETIQPSENFPLSTSPTIRPLLKKLEQTPRRTAPSLASPENTSHADLLPWCVVLWLIGLLVAATRLFSGWLRLQLWKRRSEPAIGVHAWADEMLQSLVDRFAISTRVRLLLSNKPLGPLVMGAIRPVIILPVSLLAGLPKEHLEAILLHELAHIRRHDYLVNLFQSVVEVVLFYHPAVWWIGREIREIREECCDRLAADLGPGRLAYAKALTALEEFRAAETIPAVGLRSGSLLRRIQRLLGYQQPPKRLLPGRYAAWLSVLGAAIFTVGCLVYSTVIAAEEPVASVKPAPSGMVVDEQNQPVSNAKVWVFYEKNDWGPGKMLEETVSDKDGRFVFTKQLTFATVNTSLPADRYYLFASHPGKAPAWATITSGDPDPSTFNLILTPPKPQSFEVVDVEGNPIKGARLWLDYAGTGKSRSFASSFRLTSDAGVASAVTDEHGRATLSDLPDTSRSIAATCNGYEDNRECTTSADGTQRFVLQREATLEGRVTDPLGIPVEGAIVWLYPKFAYHQYFTARTDKQGRYRVEKIWCNREAKDWGAYQVGVYQVGIRHPRFVSLLREVKFASSEAKKDFDLQAIPGVRLIGKLVDPATGNPVVGGSVEVVSELSGRQILWSDAKGEITTMVAAGPVILSAEQPPPGFYCVKEINSMSRGSTIDTVALGKETRVTINTRGELRRVGSIRGTINLPDGSPAANATVYSFFPGNMIRIGQARTNSLRNIHTDGGGRFSHDSFPVGIPFGLYVESSDGKAAGVLPATHHPSDKPLHLQLQPTERSIIIPRGDRNETLPSTSFTVRPIVGDTPLTSASRTIKTSKSGKLTLRRTIPGMTYGISRSTDNQQRVVPIPIDSGDNQPKIVEFHERFHVQLKGENDEPLKLVKIEDFTGHTLRDGKIRPWTMFEFPILERISDSEIVVKRSNFPPANAGDKMEFWFRTEGDAVVHAVGTFPENGIKRIEAKITEPLRKPRFEPDPTITVTEETIGSLVGRVVDPDGKPVENASVTIVGGWWSFQKPFTTDKTGRFEIALNSKPYRYLEISKEGYATVWITDMPVGVGFKTQLHKSTRLRGRLVNQDGVPTQATIKLITDLPTSDNERGLRFKITGLQQSITTTPTGDYDIPLEPETYRYEISTEKDGFLLGEIVIRKDETQSLPERIEGGASATLTVIDAETGKPIPGVPLEIFEDLGPSSRRILAGSNRTTDHEGKARWENLMPGNTTFRARGMVDPAYDPSSRKHPLPYSRWSSDKMTNHWSRVDFRKEPPREDEGSQDINFELTHGFEATIEMERGVEVAGKVVDPDGKPVERATIYVVQKGGARRGLTGDSRYQMVIETDGTFFGYIPAGNGVTYNLCASRHNDRTLTSAVSEPFDSKPGDKLKFELQMGKGGWITGRIVDAKGAPIPDMEVNSIAEDRMDHRLADRFTTTDKQGRFRLGPLRPGAYTVRPDTAPGFNTNTSIKGISVTVEQEATREAGDIIFSQKK